METNSVLLRWLLPPPQDRTTLASHPALLRSSVSEVMSSTMVVSHHDTMMLPASGSESDGTSRMVRFDSECVLIPEPTKRPKGKVLTKSYSLPLWKRKPSTSSDSETEGCSPLNTEDTHVVFKVPIPRCVRSGFRRVKNGRNGTWIQVYFAFPESGPNDIAILAAETSLSMPCTPYTILVSTMYYTTQTYPKDFSTHLRYQQGQK